MTELSPKGVKTRKRERRHEYQAGEKALAAPERSVGGGKSSPNEEARAQEEKENA